MGTEVTEVVHDLDAGFRIAPRPGPQSPARGSTGGAEVALCSGDAPAQVRNVAESGVDCSAQPLLVAIAVCKKQKVVCEGARGYPPSSRIMRIQGLMSRASQVIESGQPWGMPTSRW